MRPGALPPGDRLAGPANAGYRARRPLLNLSDWPVSRRLFAVIAAALLMGVIFGGLRVSDAEASAAQFGRTVQLAQLSAQLTTLVNDLQNQRDRALPAFNLAQSAKGTIGQSAISALTPLYSKTNADAIPIQQELPAVLTGGFPANLQAAAVSVNVIVAQANLNDLQKVLTSSTDTAAAFAEYQSDISGIVTRQAQVAQGVTDAQLTSEVQALGALALAKEQASQQRGLLSEGLTPTASPGVDPLATDAQWPLDAGTVTKLNLAFHNELVDLAAFHASASQAENAVFAAGFGPQASRLTGENLADALESDVFASATGNAASVMAGNPTSQQVASITGPNGIMMAPVVKLELAAKGVNTLAEARTLWSNGMTSELAAMQATENLIGNEIIARAGQLHSSAQRSALTFGVITVAVLLIVLLAALAVARSLVLPLRRLRAGALNIASVQLPERVKMLTESPEIAATMEVAPINVVSDDEIGQVARAFDQVHSEAVRLAGEQALLRSSFNAMFVNLSRRSQSLIERLARTIDALEQSEDDPDRLGSLFAMDHMVTRMRRNSENLLLLAGHENPRKWSSTIPLADVARAAISEIEQYNRVTLNLPPGISVVGRAVSDIVHLIAELIENATIFSPKDAQVQLTMQELTSGGVLIEILDQGIGISDARLAEMNFRLDNPPAIDVSVSRHMGLFAVARLAERHRVRVRLRPAVPQGLSALVWLPDNIVERGGRYGSVQDWPTQLTGSQPIIGAGQAGPDLALNDGGPALAGNGANGNGATAGSGLGGRETRAASGWFRGQAADGHGAPGAPGAVPDWSVRRVPGESLAGSPLAGQRVAGLPVRTPGGSPALPVRGRDPGRPMPGRGPVPRGPGGGTLALPQRSPDQARSRLAAFQRGTRRAGQQPEPGSQPGTPGQAPDAGERSER